MSASVSSVDGELNAVIKEFLEYSKLNRTLKVFEDECQKLGKPIQDLAGKNRLDDRLLKIKNQLLQHFDSGERTEFFSEWETHVNPEFREHNSYCQKLEFMLQIHFAVLPMRKIDHWSKEETEEAMLHFTYYLESRGSVLSDCAELLPYYALPYVPRPITHPTFAEIFEESWVSKLRSKIDVFLEEGLKATEEEEQEPRLIELYHNRDLDLQDARKELQYLERHIEESEKRSVIHAKRCEKLQEECRQLMAVASLLVTALENAVKGNLVDMDCVLSACTTHLPDLSRLRNESPSFLKNAKIVHTKAGVDRNANIVKENLDFVKLKEGLRSSNNRMRSLLFQALRWRMTKVSNWSKREEDVLEFVEQDLFDFTSQSDNDLKIYSFLQSSDPLLLESVIRFVNALSSFVLGRQYLTTNAKLIELMVACLMTDAPKKSTVISLILGTLKKLSIRKTCQVYMVDNGVIEWLTDALHSKSLSSNYALYSAVALFFNLSLNPNGKKRCEPLKVELIATLGKLLQLNDSKLSPYVNGILYRVLSIPSVKDYAKEQALPNALRKLMSRAEGEPKKQLETILELFVTDVQIEDGSSDEEDEDQENDSLDSEIDADDELASGSEANGENLLKYYYKGQATSELLCLQNTDLKDKLELTPLGIADSEIKRTLSELPLNQENTPPGSPYSELPVTPKLDVEATQLVRKIVGTPSTTLVEAAVIPDPASVTIKGLNANEYTVAFSSRPKIPRTPEPGETASPKVGSSSPLHNFYNQPGIHCNN